MSLPVHLTSMNLTADDLIMIPLIMLVFRTLISRSSITTRIRKLSVIILSTTFLIRIRNINMITAACLPLDPAKMAVSLLHGFAPTTTCPARSRAHARTCTRQSRVLQHTRATHRPKWPGKPGVRNTRRTVHTAGNAKGGRRERVSLKGLARKCVMPPLSRRRLLARRFPRLLQPQLMRKHERTVGNACPGSGVGGGLVRRKRAPMRLSRVDTMIQAEIVPD